MKMAHRLLVVASLIGLSHQLPFVLQNCGLTGTASQGIEIFPQSTAAYCPTTSYPKCNSTMLVEKDNTLTCPYGARSTIAYRNNSAIWLVTDKITCVNGALTNGKGVPLWNLMRPTCAFLSPCESCPITEEKEACPEGSTCNSANYIRGIDATDGCDRVSCANSATLTLYDDAKNVMPFTSQKLYCTIANKWQNYSLNGNLAGGTAVTGTFSANCKLPASCETCRDPNLIVGPADMPAAFVDYTKINPTVNKQAGLCSTVTCPNGFQLMGFVGTDASQTGQNWTSQNIMKCAANGQWTNGNLGYTPQNMKVMCMQKPSPCAANDVVLGNTFDLVCNEQTKLYSLTCATGKKLSMRYATDSSTVRYDRATFFAGKGWLAHGCDATAALFTTAAGKAINAVCA